MLLTLLLTSNHWSWSGHEALLAGHSVGWMDLVNCKYTHGAFFYCSIGHSKRTVGLGQGTGKRGLSIGGERILGPGPKQPPDGQ